MDLSITPVWSSWRQAVHLGLKIVWWAFSQAEVVMRYSDCAAERNKPRGCDAIISFFWEKVLLQVWETGAWIMNVWETLIILLWKCDKTAAKSNWSKLNKSELYSDQRWQIVQHSFSNFSPNTKGTQTWFICKCLQSKHCEKTIPQREHMYINNTRWPRFCAAEWLQIC